MSISKSLLLTLFMTFLLGLGNYPSKGKMIVCGRVKVDYVTDKSSDNSTTVTVKATGGQAPYFFVLLDGENKLVSREFGKNVFENLKPGSYRCLVSDSQDCSAELEIKVQ
jgi:hypothetical protein